MNTKLQKTIREIERAKAKIAELQALLPEMEKQKVDMENTEIVRLVRSAYVAPKDLQAFLQSLKARLEPPAAAELEPAVESDPIGVEDGSDA